MPPPPPWVSIVRDVTQLASLIGLACLLLGLVGSMFSPRLKEMKRLLVTIGVGLLAACFVAGGIVGFIAYGIAQRHRDGSL